MRDLAAKVQTNCIRIKSHDCIDDSIKVFSNIAHSRRLRRESSEDFSWPRDAIVVIKNLSEQDCALSVEMLRTDSEYIVLRSSKSMARTLKAGDTGTHVLHAGEAWTLRSCDAVEPVGHRLGI